MNTLHSINKESRLYVMKCGGGFSCYGFEVLDRKARAVAAWLSREMPTHPDFYEFQRVAHFGDRMPELGTPEHYALCMEMMQKGGEFSSRTSKRCPAELVPALVGLEGKRVECDYFGERVRFYVGKSTGWMPAHLRIATRRSSGGDALIADAVKNVRIVGGANG